ncbi:peptidylprolyl isomerase [Schleiferia thermophila]|jgi:peptidylprolyl isomerase|uniref:peptidylprolyl isomerase n=1 Tax=Schleiferia thermophila TaxID=884107 RepID=A0A368ZYW6_9FLAO|nr:peptidylprolyl isomerase [Schleiferia thermophila]KFD38233.1 peptidylprolyl isomerase [Schleiferia thermophila str. Yellowstone]RCX02155.1 peptidylprolyl isomerase [Schleiferia thermophila]GCD80676.1 peptidylprolyl isomerase [Schleiferia thermophila]
MRKVTSLLALVLLATACNSQPKTKSGLEDGLYAVIKTNKGDITLKLYHDKTPMTVANFVGLAEGKIENSARKKGEPFYNGLKFHRVIADFMIQGGDPSGNGSGGPGYQFEDEIVPELKHDGPGVLSMANAGPNTNGSQFFITHKETPWLDGRHTVFGRVVEGQEVVNAIQQGDEIVSVTILRIGKELKHYDPVRTFEESRKAIREKRELQARKAKEEFENLKSAAQSTASGLAYIVMQEGTGQPAKKGQFVTCHYTLTLVDGQKIDSSLDRGQPFRFQVGMGQVIKGWDEALQMFGPGTKVKLLIPPHLGYGERGAGGVIPPNADLIFDVEVLAVE